MCAQRTGVPAGRPGTLGGPPDPHCQRRQAWAGSRASHVTGGCGCGCGCGNAVDGCVRGHRRWLPHRGPQHPIAEPSATDRLDGERAVPACHPRQSRVELGAPVVRHWPEEGERDVPLVRRGPAQIRRRGARPVHGREQRLGDLGGWDGRHEQSGRQLNLPGTTTSLE